jgi:hypothetical protein
MSGALKFSKDVASKLGNGHVASIADEIDGNNTEGAGDREMLSLWTAPARIVRGLAQIDQSAGFITG